MRISFFFALLSNFAAYLVIGARALYGVLPIGDVLLYAGSVTRAMSDLQTFLATGSEFDYINSYLSTYEDFIAQPSMAYDGTLPIEKRDDGQYEFAFHDVSFSYPGTDLPVLEHVTLSFAVGEKTALVGRNGAGKTTTLHTITGLLSPKKGSVMFEGTDITKIPAHKIVSMGMAHVPEGRRVFAELSVYENLKMGAYTRKDKNEIEESLANVYKRFPRLEERRNQMAGTLSGGEQQMLAMGRALMSKPKIILMDEPSMGLSPIFVNEIFDIIQAVSESGTTVLLVEQNAKKALSIADRAYVLETGKITMSGNAKDLLEDEAVKKAYLGE